MMITISGRHALRRTAVLLWSLVFTQAAHAWQQEYIAVDPQSNTSERYTWDSDRTPRYEEILAERVAKTQHDEAQVTPMGLNLSLSLPVTVRPVAAGGARPAGFPFRRTARARTTLTGIRASARSAGGSIPALARSARGRRSAITSSTAIRCGICSRCCRAASMARGWMSRSGPICRLTSMSRPGRHSPRRKGD